MIWTINKAKAYAVDRQANRFDWVYNLKNAAFTSQTVYFIYGLCL